MGVGSTFGGFGAFGAGSRVKTTITLLMEGDKIVERKVTRVGKTMDEQLGIRPTIAIQRTRASLGMLLRDMVKLRSVIPTVAKALISGFAITAVFSSIFAVLGTIRLAFRGVVEGIRSGIQAVGDFQKATLGLTALLSTFFAFSEDQATNFKIAGSLARDLQEELIRRNKESIANIEQLQLSLQAAIGGGLFKFVKTGREAVDVIILLSNAIAAVTTGMDQTRQLQQEVRDLFQGTLRTTAQLSNILDDVIPGGIRKLLKEAEKTKDLAQTLGGFLGGFAIASEQFGRTLDGIKTTFQSILILFQLQVFEKVTDRILGNLSELASRLQGDLAPLIARIAVRLSFAFDDALAKFLQVIGAGQSFESILIRLRPIIDRISDGLVGVADRLAKLFLFVLERALGILELISKGQFISALVGTLGTGAELIGRIIARAFISEIGATAKALADLPAPRGGVGSEFRGIAPLVRRLQDERQGQLEGGVPRSAEAEAAIQRSTVGALRARDALERARVERFEDLTEAVEKFRTFVIGLDDDISAFFRGIGEDSEDAAKRLRAVNSELESLRDTLASALKKTARGPIEEGLIRQRELILNFFRDLARASEAAGFAIKPNNEELQRMADLIQGIVGAEGLVKLENLQQKAGQFAVRQAEREAGRLSDIAKRNLQIANVSVSGFARTLTIQEKVTRALRDATFQVEVLSDRNRARGANAAAVLLLEQQLLDILNNQAVALERQLRLEQQRRETRQLQERFRLEQRGITIRGFAPVGVRGLLDERSKLQSQLESGEGTEADLVGLGRDLAGVEDQLQSIFNRASSVADVVGGAMTRAFLDLLDKGGGIKAFLKDISAGLREVGEQLLFAFGTALANAITGLIQGTQGIKGAIGGLIIAVGNLAIAFGTVLLLIGLIPGFQSNIPLGLALIAAGTGLIAFGSLLGGSGDTLGAGGQAAAADNQIPTFNFQQEQVNVQQGQQVATTTANLVTATDNMNAATSRFKSMPAGEVVVVGNEQKGGAARILSTDLKTGKAISAGREIALSLRGGS